MAESDPTSQAVTPAEPSASQTTETPEGTQADSLDDVLSQIDQEFTEATSEPPAATTPPADTVTRAEFNALLNELAEKDVGDAVSQVKERMGDGVSLSDRAVRGILNEMANEDPRLRNAFANRKTNPAAWSRALTAIAQEIQGEVPQPVDTQVTQDREAIAAAVRGARTADATGDEAPNFRAMNDAELAEWKRLNG